MSGDLVLEISGYMSFARIDLSISYGTRRSGDLRFYFDYGGIYELQAVYPRQIRIVLSRVVRRWAIPISATPASLNRQIPAPKRYLLRRHASGSAQVCTKPLCSRPR